MQRPPDFVPLRKSVAARHYADDRDWRAADANDAADGVCRPVQLVLPEVVSDHRDLFRATPVVAFPRGRSPFGLVDVAGNVREWTATEGPTPGAYGVRGSAWDEGPGAGRVATRHACPRALRAVTLGFRCASGG